MRTKFFFILLSYTFYFVNAQDKTYQEVVEKLNNCESNKCKAKYSFILAEFFLEVDDIKKSQQWLNKTKDLVVFSQSDTVKFYIHSLQSELFYYDGLYQFGINEATKAIKIAKNTNVDLLKANGYFFKGINEFELEQFSNSEESLWKAKYYQTSTTKNKSMRSAITNEYIFNNLAQLKLKIHQTDSAIWYNQKAYLFAKAANSKRGIPNVEHTFGQIFLGKKNMDSASFYFKKSINSATKYNYHDIELNNCGFLMRCFLSNQQMNNYWYQEGLKLIRQKKINIAFQQYFYQTAKEVFSETNQIDNLSKVQSEIISINDNIRLKGNLNLQEITEQYAKNENKFLKFQIQELKKERRFVLLQLVLAFLSVIILSLIVFIFRRKNILQNNLLNQKNEISKNLHDDIGSGLSTILIHADLLSKNEGLSERNLILASKINTIGGEISQRLNAFIWSLDDEYNTLQHFSEYIKRYGESLFEETPVLFSFSSSIEDSSLIKMNGQLRKNLFYAIKEVLNNTLKHAQATKIDVKVKLDTSKQLQISLHDNGAGFNKENPLGNGIKNMKNRLEQIKGEVSMNTQNGWLTILKIPL